jgi:predicted small metal-binding protein
MDSSQMDVYMRGSYIPLDCHFIVAAHTEAGSVVFTEVYHIRRYHGLQTIKLGEWHPASGPGWTNLSFYNRRRDLQGVAINAAVISDVSKFQWCLKVSLLTALTLIVSAAYTIHSAI